MSQDLKPLGIGLLGFGVVGSELVRSLEEDRELWERRWNVSPRVVRVAVRDLKRKRSFELPAGCLTDKAEEVIDDPGVHTVVEVTGRIEEARGWLRRALEQNKHVVTANKALLARHMGELEELAREHQVSLAYESAVAGGIPVMRALRNALSTYGVREIVGILNGTTHYMLTRMERERMSFDTALSEAQRAGFAEPDPSDDVSGEDAACKLAILARIALALPVTRKDVFCEGIKDVKPRDLRLAAKLGYVVKPVAVVRRSAEEGHWELRVHPALMPASSPLGRLAMEENGIHVITESRGDYFLSGRGAGGPPTAGAILSDLLAIALRPEPYSAIGLSSTASTVSSEKFVTGHYLRVTGEASEVKKVLENEDIDVKASVSDGDEVALITGRGTPASILSPLAGGSREAPLAWLRVEGELPA